MQKLISLILLLIFFQVSFAMDKNTIFETLKSKFKDIDGIYLEVRSLRSGLEGKIKAEKGNKYKIFFGDRQIISNGKTIWNYSLKDKQVLISNFAKLNSAGIETIFFNMIENSEPISLKKVSASSRSSFYELILSNKKTNEKIILEIDNDNQIKFVNLVEMNEKWEIVQLDIQKESNTNFDFEAPEGVEIIDLR